MRKPHRVDGNQRQITEELRQVPGITVLVMSQLGHGAPDICVGFAGRNYFFEIKDPTKPPSKQKLTEDEAIFFAEWQGHIKKVKSTADVLYELGISR